MKRRKFLKGAALSAVLLPTVVLHACSTNPTSGQKKKDSLNSFELDEITIDDLQKAMQTGKYTARSIAEMYLRRMDEIDRNGHTLRSVIEVNPDALAIADAMDNERKNGKVRGPLHGIPVLIKDNIDTADKMMTTAGSLALEGNYASADAFIVQQMRNAGAVLLGKTNLSEWANFRSTRSSSGWSSRGGQTRNPYVLDRNPCGSSSGSGTAVAANLCAFAIGTETNGSIGCPSSINGVVGIKPTVGLLSRSGIIPISQTQDTAGPMARTVQDAAIALGVLAGVDPNDPVTKESEGKAHTDYTQFLNADALQGKRIGVERSFMKGHEAVDTLLKNALDILKQKGSEVVEVDLLKAVEGISGDEYEVLQFEFKNGLNRYLGKLKGRVRSLRDVIEFNRENEVRTMPYFKQEILESSEAKGSLESPEYQEALKKILAVTRNGIDNTLNKQGLDAICGPMNGPSWCTDPVNGDYFTGYGLYSTPAIAGYPHVSVPMGMVYGLPVGLTFLGTAYSEPQLISIAFAYEQASRMRQAPKFLYTAIDN